MDVSTLSAMPTIKLVMTPFPYYVELDDPVERAREMMSTHDVHHVPVQEHGKLMGILSRLEVERSDGQASGNGRFVRDTHITEAFVVDLTHPVDEVLEEMIQRHLGSVLVTRKDKLVGIFSTTDACRVLEEMLQSKFSPSGGEAA